jgi:hypothetical protein
MRALRDCMLGRVPVGYGDGVQATVVATGAPRPILLGNQVLKVSWRSE